MKISRRENVIFKIYYNLTKMRCWLRERGGWGLDREFWRADTLAYVPVW